MSPPSLYLSPFMSQTISGKKLYTSPPADVSTPLTLCVSSYFSLSLHVSPPISLSPFMSLHLTASNYFGISSTPPLHPMSLFIRSSLSLSASNFLNKISYTSSPADFSLSRSLSLSLSLSLWHPVQLNSSLFSARVLSLEAPTNDKRTGKQKNKSKQ